MHGFNDQRRKPLEPRYGRGAQRILRSERSQPVIRTMPQRTIETGKTLNTGRISPTPSPYNSISSRSQRARSLTTSANSYSTPSSTPPPSQIRTLNINMNIGSHHSKEGNLNLPDYSPSLLDASPKPNGITAPRFRHHEARPLPVRSRVQSLRCPGENDNSIASREISSSSQWISHDRQSHEKENKSMLGNSSSGRGYTLESRPVASFIRERRSKQSTLTSSNSVTCSGIVGLSNLGNTCFMNAALQCIAHTPSLAQHFFTNSYLDANSNDDKLASSFAIVLKRIYQGSNVSSFQPRAFLENLIQVAPQFDGGRQHDCHEFIRVLIDQLSEDLCTSPSDCMQNVDLDKLPFLAAANYSWKQHLSTNSSFITNEFCGQLVSTLECSVCRSQRFTFDPFYDLSLPFPEAKPGSEHRWLRRASRMHADQLSSCSLDDCLNAFTEPELLIDDNMTECAHCKQKQESTKSLQVHRFPRILVLHLKRFGNDRKKIRTSVDFPIAGFDASTLALNNEHRPTITPVYDLFATCEHSGRLNYGHYTATCLEPTSGNWYEFNDDYVCQCGPEEIDQSAAYVLFYRQRTS